MGLKENVEELHEFLYPDEETTGVSETVQDISNSISSLTGVTRPASLDQEQSEDGTMNENSSEDEETSTAVSNKPVISTSDE